MKAIIPSIYVALVIILQSLVLTLPAVHPMFVEGGLTAMIFTIALVTAHMGVFWPNLRVKHIFLLMALLPLVEAVLVLSVGTMASMGVGGEFISKIAEMEWDGLIRSLVIQLPISLMVLFGRWVGERFARFSYRRAALDEDEQFKLFQFRHNLLGDDENTFYKYRSLLSRSLTVVGDRKNLIYGAISALRVEDTLYLYDHFFKEDTPDPNIARNLPIALVNRADILTSSLTEVIATLPERSSHLIDVYRSLGFEQIENSREVGEIRARLNELLSHKYMDYRPFQLVEYAFRYPLPPLEERLENYQKA